MHIEFFYGKRSWVISSKVASRMEVAETDSGLNQVVSYFIWGEVQTEVLMIYFRWKHMKEVSFISTVTIYTYQLLSARDNADL